MRWRNAMRQRREHPTSAHAGPGDAMEPGLAHVKASGAWICPKERPKTGYAQKSTAPAGAMEPTQTGHAQSRSSAAPTVLETKRHEDGQPEATEGENCFKPRGFAI